MSVCGAEGTGKEGYDFYHFNQKLLYEISECVFNCIYEMHHPDPEKEPYKEIKKIIEETFMTQTKEQIAAMFD